MKAFQSIACLFVAINAVSAAAITATGAATQLSSVVEGSNTYIGSKVCYQFPASQNQHYSSLAGKRSIELPSTAHGY
jgi:hypothetical protein